MDAKKINRMLNLLAVIQLATAVIIVILFETGLAPSGTVGPNYVGQIAVVLTTLLCVPLALKLMAFRRIHQQVEGNLPRYYAYGLMRISLLGVPILLGLLVYYISLDASALYCALIAALAFLFIWPTMDRLERETAWDSESRA